MLRQIVSFIEELGRTLNLKPYDIEFHEAISSRFIPIKLEYKLTEEDINFLVTQFRHRWSKIIDSENDYTLNPFGVNRLWIRLAKELATHIGKNYIQVLFPTIYNTLDFNSLTPLTETERTDNFYLGLGPVLYRKRGLCEHLIASKFVLSTYRELERSKLKPLTVNELTRLQTCVQDKGQFSINDESFLSFWDFLQKKAFPQLNPKDVVPHQLLKVFLKLIGNYFLLKRAGDRFQSFKDALQDFFTYLYSNELEHINYFYGTKVEFNGKRHYLIDALIVLNKAKEFDIDDKLISLLASFFHISQSLRDEVREVSTLCISLMDRSPKDKTYHAKSLLLSLFTIEFAYLPLTGKIVANWDRSNTVFSTAEEMYARLMPLIAIDDVSKLPAVYDALVRDFIEPYLASVSLSSILSYTVIDEWYKHSKRGTLLNLGVRWFEPELLLHTLLRFSVHNLPVWMKVHVFLDNLVHTYAQSKEISDFQKQLRVNILFSELLGTLDLETKNILLLLIHRDSTLDTKSTFLENCSYHIEFSLQRINSSSSSPRFFGTLSRNVRLISPSEALNKVCKLIDAYKARLHATDAHIEPSISEMISEYLLSLSRPILTVEEKNKAQDNARGLDFVASPT